MFYEKIKPQLEGGYRILPWIRTPSALLPGSRYDTDRVADIHTRPANWRHRLYSHLGSYETMIYVIKQGSHYSRHWPKLHFGTRKETIRFKFLDGCWFPPEAPDDFAINKLFGWSYGLHHQDSVRCGWTPNKEPGRIDLFFYLYQKGKMSSAKFATVGTGFPCFMEIHLFGGRAFFSMSRFAKPTIVDSVPFQIPKIKWGYLLYPFVGGNLPARMDTKIDLQVFS